MRILFLNSIFPGQFRALARAYGAAGHTVLFLAESGQKAAVLPGVRRLRLAPPRPYESSDAAEKEGVRLLRCGARGGNAM
ncbi:MAG: glycosyl transferase family 1, partial [Desulfovibrio sp.]|nr:glycosyl transferase family 1 [Desulfovibrio sp.]